MRTVTTTERAISGFVQASGVITSGTGFRIVKTATGEYTILFPGMLLLSLTLTPQGAATFPALAGSLDTVNGQTVIRIYTPSLVVVDCAFAFTAIVRPR